MKKNVVDVGNLRIAPTILVAWKRCSERTMVIERLYRVGFQVRAETTRWGVLEQLEHGNCDLGLFDTELDDAASVDVIMLWNMVQAGWGALHIAYLGGESERQREDPGSIGISTFLCKPVTPDEIVDTVSAAVSFENRYSASGFARPRQWGQREAR